MRLGKDWSVFQGAVRFYSPRFDRNGDKFRHRLWLPAGISRLDAAFRNGFSNAVVQHVFTEITAEFESRPILTPSSVRRQLREAATPAAEVLTPFQPIESARPEQVTLPLEFETPGHPVEASTTLQISGLHKIHELEAKLEEQTQRILRLEETNEKQEMDLEQEKAGRAATEMSLSYAIEMQKMFEEDKSWLLSEV